MAEPEAEWNNFWLHYVELSTGKMKTNAFPLSVSFHAQNIWLHEGLKRSNTLERTASIHTSREIITTESYL